MKFPIIINLWCWFYFIYLVSFYFLFPRPQSLIPFFTHSILRWILINHGCLLLKIVCRIKLAFYLRGFTFFLSEISIWFLLLYCYNSALTLRLYSFHKMGSFSVLRNNLHKTLIINYKSLLQLWLYTPGEVYEEELVSGHESSQCLCPLHVPCPLISPHLASTNWLKFLVEFFLPDCMVSR